MERKTHRRGAENKQVNREKIKCRLECFLHPYGIEYPAILLSDTLETAAFDESILFVKIDAPGIQG